MNFKRKPAAILAATLLSAALLTGCGSGTKETTKATPTGSPQQVELTVSAAASMKDARAEIQKNYQTNQPHVKLLFNLGASGALQKQIEQGAPADLFISAAPKQMNELQAKKLINDVTRKNLVENRLVIVVPKESKLAITKYEDLTQASVKKIALGETVVVPAGQYAKEVLQRLALWDAVQEKVVFAKDVRTVLAYTETGNVDAGIVYKTDAAASTKVRVVTEAPAGSHQPIVYPLAILANAKQPEAAEAFVRYLFSAEGKAVLEKHGFTMSN